MKKIISFFSVVVIIAIVCTSRLTNAQAIQTYPFTIKKLPNTSGSASITDLFELTGNECELKITNMVNCNIKVILLNSNNSPITIYSPGNYHLTFTSYGSSNSLSLEFIPINQNLPSYCSGSISTT